LDLSVIIVSYDSRFFLELCLRSLKASLYKIKSEIIIVDNNSNDDTIDMIESSFSEVILIRNKYNVGFSCANNLAVKKAKGKNICFLNPDTVVPEDFFHKIIDFKKSTNNVGIIACKMIDGQGIFLPESKRNLPHTSMVIKRFFGLKNNYYLNKQSEDAIGQVDVLCGAIMFMDKQVFEDTGGFDEKYFMFGEDIDLSYKILKKGLKNYYYGDASIIHYKGESTSKNSKYYKNFYGAMGIYYRKYIAKNIFSKILSFLILELIIFFKSFMITSKLRSRTKPKDCFLISENDYVGLKNRVTIKIESIQKLSDKLENCEIIFDSNYLTFKNIISTMERLSTKKGVIFKIIPKASNYLIGTYNSREHGQVILFDLNK